MNFLLKDADKNNSRSVDLLVHFEHVGDIKGTYYLNNHLTHTVPSCSLSQTMLIIRLKIEPQNESWLIAFVYHGKFVH